MKEYQLHQASEIHVDSLFLQKIPRYVNYATLLLNAPLECSKFFEERF